MSYTSRSALVVAATLFCTNGAIASPEEDAFKAAVLANDQDKIDALAEDGNLFARLHRASEIASREAISFEDRELGAGYVDEAIEAGNANAMYLKSQDLMTNDGLFSKDVDLGHQLGVAAAEAGDPSAMLQTGIRFQYGLRGAELDIEQARHWLEAAFAAGELRAKRQLDELGG